MLNYDDTLLRVIIYMQLYIFFSFACHEYKLVMTLFKPAIFLFARTASSIRHNHHARPYPFHRGQAFSSSMFIQTQTCCPLRSPKPFSSNPSIRSSSSGGIVAEGRRRRRSSSSSQIEA
ncbi:hypothetical protein GQ55_9G457700 [Panicum hallii var. hallii]|uniref:Uncharacterized protein n=1 Tax=Panicum hallii var. hallii TaxID=1504633 RepID=A0A2T7CC08_9POAL|nr:hypothetical protein GQ55_9G457700 [Panicum hallii var. hallii]